MKTEYILNDEQKKKIQELNQKIFELQIQICNIYAMSPVRYITETEEECKNVRNYILAMDKPLLKQGIVKINKSVFERQQLPEEYQSPQEPWKDAMMNTFLNRNT